MEISSTFRSKYPWLVDAATRNRIHDPAAKRTRHRITGTLTVVNPASTAKRLTTKPVLSAAPTPRSTMNTSAIAVASFMTISFHVVPYRYLPSGRIDPV